MISNEWSLCYQQHDVVHSKGRSYRTSCTVVNSEDVLTLIM